jgi:alkylation response protein AidB-like acyl-CoA dehydrogenase
MHAITAAARPADTYLRAIAELAPMIALHREQFDLQRRIPEAVFAALADAGLFRLWLPRAFDGPEFSPMDFMTVVEAAAAIDGSVGWLVGNGGGMSRAAGYLPSAVASRLFTDRRAFVAASTGAIGTAVATKGGYRVTGRWPFGSGSHHASHFMALTSRQGSDGADIPTMCCYFPRSDVTIHDNWHVSGLRGTGSCDFEVRDAFVPAEATHVFIGPEPTQPGVVYALPTVSSLAWTVSVVPLGIAQGAITTFRDIAFSRTRAGRSTSMREQETVQAAVGRAHALCRSGRAFLVAAMSDLIEAATDPQNERAMLRAACAHAADTAVRIVDMLAEEAGAIAISESCLLERAVRDVRAAVKHIAMSPNNYIVAGRLSLGLEPLTQRF